MTGFLSLITGGEMGGDPRLREMTRGPTGMQYELNISAAA